MPYVKTNWVDEIPGETPVKYVITGPNSDCTIELKTAPTAGTPLNATNLNHIEQGIFDVEALTKIKLSNRQGDTGAWGDNYGTTNFDVSATPQKMQGGCAYVTAAGDLTVTFPVAFSQPPIVLVSVGSGVAIGLMAVTDTITASSFQVGVFSHSGARASAFFVHWLAIGPA